jgi:phytol kinase
MLHNDFLATIITFLIALAWLRLNDFAAHRGWISSHLSRKIIHMGTGPLFVLCWPLFSTAPSARFMAALVPFAITIQFILVGTGIIKDQAAVEAMSRSGNRREILRGPLFYGIIFVILTVIYWYDSPIGMVALMLLCGGDGLADVVGRHYRWRPLAWNREKSWGGTFAMFAGGWIFAAGIIAAYKALGAFTGTWNEYLLAISTIALVGTTVETLPFHDIDNLTIALVAVLMGHLLWR